MNQRDISRRKFIQTATLALPMIAAGCAGTPSLAGITGKRPREFVTVRDANFVLKGNPHSYIGTNLWYGCYLGDPTLPGGRKRLVRELDRLHRIGVNNLRLLAGSESSSLAGAIPRGITQAPHQWDEHLLCGLDFCLAEMAKRNMRAVLFLSNYWQWSGGFAQYVCWATGETIPDPDKPVRAKGDWHGFMEFSARFYETPAAIALYREYVTKLIHRHNTVNGRLYRDDPAIMTWELANEPRPGPDDASARYVENFCQWVDETARFIHAQDPNHLVCTGSEGIWGCLKKPELFLQVHSIPAIDYVTVHVWLKNWGWLKNIQPGPAYEQAAARARAHVEQHTVLATDTLHKPLVLEEFGLPRDHENYSAGSPAVTREDYFRRMFGQVTNSCRAGRTLQAANFWAWGGEGRVGAGKPYSSAVLIGDPPCEPQGLNSVFDTDTTTLAIIAQANKKLALITG